MYPLWNENRRKKMNIQTKTRKLTFLGVMLAVTFILSVLPIGFIPFGNISVTIIHVPTIITGIVLGPLYGLLMGTAMGIMSLLNGLLRPLSILDPLFINPLVSVLPRMFIGVVAYYVYQGIKRVFKKRKGGQTVGIAVGAVFGSMTNTVLVLFMLYVVYVQKLMEAFGVDSAAGVRVVLITIVTSNAIIEAIVAGVITTAIVSTYFVVNKSNRI